MPTSADWFVVLIGTGLFLFLFLVFHTKYHQRASRIEQVGGFTIQTGPQRKFLSEAIRAQACLRARIVWMLFLAWSFLCRVPWWHPRWYHDHCVESACLWCLIWCALWSDWGIDAPVLLDGIGLNPGQWYRPTSRSTTVQLWLDFAVVSHPPHCRSLLPKQYLHVLVTNTGVFLEVNAAVLGLRYWDTMVTYFEITTGFLLVHGHYWLFWDILRLTSYTTPVMVFPLLHICFLFACLVLLLGWFIVFVLRCFVTFLFVTILIRQIPQLATILPAISLVLSLAGSRTFVALACVT